jgi:hypothetical protein
MTSAIVNNIDEIRELSIDELDEAGGGLSTAGKIGILVGVVFLAGFGFGLAAAAL